MTATSRRRPLHVILVLLLAVSFAACDLDLPQDTSLPTPMVTQISEINANPASFEGQEVVVEGRAAAQPGSFNTTIGFPYDVTDATGTIVALFESDDLPPVDQDVSVVGAVFGGRVTVDGWLPIGSETVPPPTNGGQVGVSTVREVLEGRAKKGPDGGIILEGRNIRETSDRDELVFSDGTGEVVIDYPSSNIPPLNVWVRVHGTDSSSEIDAISWAPIAGPPPQ